MLRGLMKVSTLMSCNNIRHYNIYIYIYITAIINVYIIYKCIMFKFGNPLAIFALPDRLHCLIGQELATGPDVEECFELVDELHTACTSKYGCRFLIFLYFT